MTTATSRNGISLPVVDSGPLQPEPPAGPTPARSAPPRVRASRSAKPAKGSESMIQGICGRTYIESSVPPATQDSALLFGWENRLRERLAMIGSTEYALIWREKQSTLGLSISRLARSTRHTNGTDSIGSQWPTPKASAAGDRADEPLMGGLMRQATWRSPTAGDKRGGAYQDPEKAAARIASGHTVNLEDQMVVAGWSTPRASDGEKGAPLQSFGGGGQPLPSQMYANPFNTRELATWITPSARDGKDSAGMATTRPDGGSRIDQLPRQMAAIGATENGSPATTEKRGAPNPQFPCWLMGWPDEVTFGALSGIQSFLSSRRKSSARSSTPKPITPPPY